MSESKRLCVVELTYKVRVTMPEDEFRDPVMGAKFVMKDFIESGTPYKNMAIWFDVIDEKMLGYEGTEDT
jgi:hypothetical protein